MAFELIRSPSLLMKTIFWLYSIVLIVLFINVYSIFTERNILLSHLRDLFDTLTKFRIWTMRNRRIYTILVASTLMFFALAIVYVAETAHHTVYELEPMFSSIPHFFYWIVVAMVSGFEKGEAPQSFIGLIITGLMPLFILGAIFSIVRYTSEHGHMVLMEKMARGDIPTHRVIVFNYQSKFDETILRLLRKTEAFVVVFADENHLPDAKRLKANFDENSDKAYRLLIDELSYANDTLFQRYDLIGADEIYLLSDMSHETDYQNLLVLTEINKRVKQWDDMESAVYTCPQILWEVNKAKFKLLSQNLDSPILQRNFYPVGFYEDCTRELLSNLQDPLVGLNRYYGLHGTAEQHDWFDGYGLENYRFTAESITSEERELLDSLREKRRRRSTSARQDSEPSDISELKRELLARFEQRLEEESLDGDINPFYGVLAEIAGNDIPMDPSTAFLSHQMDTTRATIQVEKTEGKAQTDTTAEGAGESGLTINGHIYLMNLNNNSRYFLESLDSDAGGRPGALDVTVFHTEGQPIPELDLEIEFIQYSNVSEVARFLFRDELNDTEAKLEEGDSLLLFLDDTSNDPHIHLIRALDAIDDQLKEENDELNHNDIFLMVESTESSFNRIYEYLSVDKTIDTFQTRRTFLNNFIELRNDEVLDELERSGTLSQQQAFGWALQTAYALRHYVVQSATDLDWNETKGDALITENHITVNANLREYKRPSRQLFTSFRICKGKGERDEPIVEMIELTEEKEINEDEYLMFFPHI